MKSSASMYESSGSQFFKTTTGIQSGPNESLEKFSVNNFALSDAKDHTVGPLNRGGIADLPLLRTQLAICLKFLEPSF